MRFEILLASVLIAAASCSTKKAALNNDYIKFCPTGTVEIDSNFFCDQTEIYNLDWREYLYWTARVYGLKSDEYLNALPDTTVWLREDTCFKTFVTEYLRHPKFNFQPVVGVSQEQANAYSQWRADRILQQILLDAKLIRKDTASTPETHFTIERYFNGNLNTYLTEERVKFYPKITLPTLTERTLILSATDSVNLEKLRKGNSSKCKDCLETYPHLKLRNKPCSIAIRYYSHAVKQNKSECTKWLLPIYNLRGNVNEWSNKMDVAFGGSWKDSREQILASDTAVGSVNATTGFRNVCRWVKWEP